MTVGLKLRPTFSLTRSVQSIPESPIPAPLKSLPSDISVLRSLILSVIVVTIL